MSAVEFKPIPWRSLVLMWLAYALLGWHISAHHIIWLVGAFVAVSILAVVEKSVSWLEKFMSLGSQMLSLVLVLGVSVALVATWSILFTLFLLPLSTTILAEIDLGFAGLSKRESLWAIAAVASFGLIVGETVDLLFFPSFRY
jgi:hypothetical protein